MAFARVVAFSVLLASPAVTHTVRDSSVDTLLSKGIEALGGAKAIDGLHGVTFQAASIYRSRSLMQSYELNLADTAVAISGQQNISFSFTSDELVQRIDRRWTPSSYWSWARPSLDPFDFSLVVRGGNDGYACFVRGNNQVWLPSNATSGYTDSALAEYLVLHGEMLSPILLSKLKSSHDTKASKVQINGIEYPAVQQRSSDITVIFDPDSHLPFIIRTIENHNIYGKSTNDLYLTDYRSVNGVYFPHRVQTVYNSTSQALNAPLEDFQIETVTVNPKFPADYFQGLPENQSWFPKAAPERIEGITHWWLTEFFGNGLWAGVKNSTVEGIKVEQPVKGLPKVHWVIVDDDILGVKQMILEFENSVIVCDAPPQWTLSVIQWIKEDLKKPVSHIWPTHHHRDHSGGANEYVAIGAKLIVPEMAVPYWSSIPNATFETFNETHPFVYEDKNMQAWFTWQNQATHASDWSYAFVTEKCATKKSPVAVFEADAWQAGLPAEESDQGLMRQWLDQLLKDGLTPDAFVLPTHGQVTPLTQLLNITGYPYPLNSFSAASWKGGVAKC
ncbi:hypothetical protein V8C35DRAFT_279576 [Trichoderma chlorosporum]